MSTIKQHYFVGLSERRTMTVLDTIKSLAEKRGKTLRQVTDDLKFSENYLYSLKTKTPNGANLEKLADYFNVSVDYLLGRSNFEQYDGVNKAVNEMLASKEQYFDLVSLLNADNPDSVTKNDLKDFTVLNSFRAFSEDYVKIPTDKRWELANGISLLNYSLHNLDDQQSKILGEILKAVHGFLFSINGFNYDDELNDEDKKLSDIEKTYQTNTYENIYKINELLIEFTEKYKNDSK